MLYTGKENWMPQNQTCEQLSKQDKCSECGRNTMNGSRKHRICWECEEEATNENT